MNNTDIINGRFKTAPWYAGCKDEIIYIVGLGGIGSNAVYNLTKTVPCNYWIQDFDTVEDINVGTQLYNIEDIGKLKTTATLNHVAQYNKDLNIVQSNSKYTGVTQDIMIAALDNMATRKEMFEAWKLRETRELFVDARLRANFYEIFVVTPGESEDKYENTLFKDDEIESSPCTFKSTAYFGMLCGARITQVIVNYLSNKYSEDKIYSVPFEIREFGDLMFFETK